MENNPRSLTWRLLFTLVLSLLTVLCYQIGHVRGYDAATEALAGRPIVVVTQGPGLGGDSDALDALDAAVDRDAIAFQPSGEPIVPPKS